MNIVHSERILYTASPFARSSLLHLQEIGWLSALQPHTNARDNLHSFLLLFVDSGTGKLQYDRQEYSLGKDWCAFIDCRKPYSHSTDQNLWTLKWCHFDGPMMPSVYEKYKERGGRPVFMPQKPIGEALKETWKTLMDAARSSDYMRDMLINQHLAALITLLMRESWHPEEKRSASKQASVLEVKEWLDSHYAENITLDSLSNRFFINKYYLSKCFKAQFGLTISAYLLSVRITHAKQLLRFTVKTIEQIGTETGIGSPDYFSSVFKMVEGIPPSQYRKQW